MPDYIDYEEFAIDLGEMREIMSRPPEVDSKSSTQTTARPGWDEGLGYHGANRALRIGVERQRLTHLSNQLRRHLTAHFTEVDTERLSQKGKRLDRRRYRQGKPRCTWKTDSTNEVDHAVHIDVDIAANAGVSSDVWVQRGAALLALLREARRQGVSVKLDAVAPNERPFVESEKNIMFRIHIKEAGEAVAQKIINFVFAHSAFFRRGVFRLIEECADRMDEQVNMGYGRSPADRDTFDTKADLYIPQWEETRSPEKVMDIAVNWTNKITEDVR